MKMSELKEKDPTMYAALKKKYAKKNAARKAALALIIAFAKDNGDDELKKAALLLTPRSGGGASGARKPFLQILDQLFANGSTITEDEAWATLRLGRAEMRQITIKAIKLAKPEDRIWVSFDPQEGVYELKGTGPDAPEGWVGYRPLVVNGEEIQ